MTEYVLYDLPNPGRNSCWSVNTWKTRAALNFKGIPYKTEWVEFPDIAPLLQSLGLSPNDKPLDPYTLPALRFNSSLILMDSSKIARQIEKEHPTPSLHLDSPILPRLGEIIFPIVGPLAPVYYPKVAQSVLNPPSQEYFNKKRSESIGMSLTEYEKLGGDKAWEEAKTPIMNFAELIKAQGGPYVLGKTPSYADIVILGVLQFLKRVDPNMFERFVAHDPIFMENYNACMEWLAKDD